MSKQTRRRFQAERNSEQAWALAGRLAKQRHYLWAFFLRRNIRRLNAYDPMFMTGLGIASAQAKGAARLAVAVALLLPPALYGIHHAYTILF